MGTKLWSSGDYRMIPDWAATLLLFGVVVSAIVLLVGVVFRD